MEEKKCQKCVHRGFKGLCRVLEIHVPRKRRLDGTNPALECKHFSKKGS